MVSEEATAIIWDLISEVFVMGFDKILSSFC